MKVLKFGGTSVGLPQRMHHVAQLVTADKESKVVVLSAVSGTTNALVEIGELLLKGNKSGATKKIDTLYDKYLDFYKELLSEEESLFKGKEIIDTHFGFIRYLLDSSFSEWKEKELLAQGELLSTKLFYTYLKEIGIKAVLLPALDFMYIDEDGEPDVEYIREKLHERLADNKGNQIFVTQGFICKNAEGLIDNLKRGGSDYSASLIGAALQADEVQIWTDISGMHNNDPRIVEDTFPIAELSFEEAAELAYFGAKILHPSSILPTQKYNVPVHLLNTMQPQAKGTLISSKQNPGAIKAVAAKDGIIAIKIKSSRMLLAYGFLRKIFEIFEKYKTPIDMITTSEVAVSLTIDDDSQLGAILDELKEFGTVQVDEELSIVCIVGDFVSEKKGIIEKVIHSMNDIPLRMVSFGGSKNNISLLIETEKKREALLSLNKGLFHK
ncbi:aspartate kinase [Xanthovirga aplysinae]|uniref:aspartate kinase n=1 Tax=Xanthovirga aplysinae TaxID=2529853 RepID=UPI0012BC8291|nr:aspartate kinase [Xanthovirga aplysinae]MTI33431.1 aspartate kinase [Xanthovirga aplysinae]